MFLFMFRFGFQAQGLQLTGPAGLMRRPRRDLKKGCPTSRGG